MSNNLWPSGRTAIADQTVDLISDTVQVVALSSAYTYDSNHSVRSDLTGELGTAQTLSGKSWLPDAIFDAGNLSYPGVTLGQTVERLVIFVDSGSSSTSLLIAYIDETTQGVAIAVAGDGTSIPILWDDSAHRVFRL